MSRLKGFIKHIRNFLFFINNKLLEVKRGIILCILAFIFNEACQLNINVRILFYYLFILLIKRAGGATNCGYSIWALP
jgi:hypothetical protein